METPFAIKRHGSVSLGVAVGNERRTGRFAVDLQYVVVLPVMSRTGVGHCCGRCHQKESACQFYLHVFFVLLYFQ